MQIRKIPWYGTGAIHEQDDIDAVVELIKPCITESKGFFRLPEETEFQKAFAEYEEAKYASAVNSCGTGLDLALRIINVGPGDEVITTPMTFVCTGTCILLRGAKVVFADIDPVTYNLDPAGAEVKITEKTKAIIPVHFNGIPVDIDGFERLGKKYGVKIIYDAAHAAGTKYKGKKIGGFGDMSAFSFQSNKNISTLGEGGAVTTDNVEYFEKLERYKSFGFKYLPEEEVEEAGTNFRMTKLQSAVGLTQLKKLDKNIAVRKQHTDYLNEKLSDVEGIITPKEPDYSESAYHLYALLFDDSILKGNRDEFVKILKQKYLIDIRIQYKAVYEWQVFKKLGYCGDGTPTAARVARQIFNLPVFPMRPMEDYDYMVWAIKEAISEID